MYGGFTLTAIQDIIADLADSGVIIQERDIEKKSKKEAFLVSYKISVKAEDLQRALDPSVWPLRVKVREFIHYARKHPRQQREQHGHQHGHHQQQGHRQVVQHDHNPDVQASDAQQAGGHREQGELSVATNRYALPEDNVPGGPQV